MTERVCEVTNPPRFGETLTVMLEPPEVRVVVEAVFEYALRFPAASVARTR